MSNLDDILKTAIDNKASDIHIIVGQPPLIRLHTQVTATDFPVVTADGAMRMVKEMLTDKRVDAHFQRNTVAMAFRVITDKVRPLDQLNMPEIITRLTYLPRGLVLVTGD